MENRDDLLVNDSYAPMVNHSEEEGKAIRKKIWFVTILLSTLTAIEIFMGIVLSQRDSGYWPVIKWTFIIMTIVKAFYIVMEFMHLGHENKTLRKLIIVPYVFFIIYMIYLIVQEGFMVGAGYN
jgi:cytochrome c oxidase subunit IV